MGAAHVGVGIIGREGTEAVNNSDFAIGKFRFLRGLLLVHGFQNYRRYAVFFYFSFYQTTCFAISLMGYATITLAMPASVAPLYNDWFLNFYTVFYTSLPLIVIGFNNQYAP